MVMDKIPDNKSLVARVVSVNFFLICIIFFNFQQLVSASCVFSDGQIGECVKFEECRSAIISSQKGVNPGFCSIEENTVCCTDYNGNSQRTRRPHTDVQSGSPRKWAAETSNLMTSSSQQRDSSEEDSHFQRRKHSVGFDSSENHYGKKRGNSDNDPYKFEVPNGFYADSELGNKPSRRPSRPKCEQNEDNHFIPPGQAKKKPWRDEKPTEDEYFVEQVTKKSTRGPNRKGSNKHTGNSYDNSRKWGEINTTRRPEFYDQDGRKTTNNWYHGQNEHENPYSNERTTKRNNWGQETYTTRRPDHFNGGGNEYGVNEEEYSNAKPGKRPQTTIRPNRPNFQGSSNGENQRPTYQGNKRPSYQEGSQYEGNRPSYQQGNKRPSYQEGSQYENNRPNSQQGNKRPTYQEGSQYEGNRPNSQQGNKRPTYQEGSQYEGNRPSYQQGNKRPSYQEGSQYENNRPSSQQGNKRPTYQEGSQYEGNRPNYQQNFNPEENYSNSRPRPGSQKRKRLSERKCEEYSKQITENITGLPLTTNPDPVTIPVRKCITPQQLIVGGENTTVGEFPHMAAIGFRDRNKKQISWNCGGSLISELFVMTAAHCTSTSSGRPVKVRLGEYNLMKNDDGAYPVDYAVVDIITHPEYKPPAKYNDIALLKLSRKVTFFKHIRPACLYSEDSFTGTKAIATGWGRMYYDGGTSEILQKVVLSIVDNNTCNRLYKVNVKTEVLSKGIINSQLCAGELSGGKDTCQGDSGGPLSITNTKCIHHIIGITSFGKSCALPNSTGVYTRVSAYVDWIESVVWSSNV